MELICFWARALASAATSLCDASGTNARCRQRHVKTTTTTQLGDPPRSGRHAATAGLLVSRSETCPLRPGVRLQCSVSGYLRLELFENATGSPTDVVFAAPLRALPDKLTQALEQAGKNDDSRQIPADDDRGVGRERP